MKFMVEIPDAEVDAVFEREQPGTTREEVVREELLNGIDCGTSFIHYDVSTSELGALAIKLADENARSTVESVITHVGDWLHIHEDDEADVADEIRYLLLRGLIERRAGCGSRFLRFKKERGAA